MIDTTTISKHESGARNPTAEELKGYATIFKVPVDLIYADIYTREQVVDTLYHQGEWWKALQAVNHPETA